jgi:hypothetical protein
MNLDFVFGAVKPTPKITPTKTKTKGNSTNWFTLIY